MRTLGQSMTGASAYHAVLMDCRELSLWPHVLEGLKIYITHISAKESVLSKAWLIGAKIDFWR